MIARALFLLLPLALAGCAASLPFGFGGRGDAGGADGSEVTVTQSPSDEVVRPRPRAGSTREARGGEVGTPGRAPAQTAAPAPAADGFLGETLAGLGAPAEGGLWLVTGLVDRPRPGRIVTEDGRALSVELRPSGGPPGGGSQISLAAMQTLGLNLARLVTLRVYVD